MSQVCSTHYSTKTCLTHLVRLTWPCLTPFDTRFDSVWPMIWHCSTLSTLFNSLFDPVWPMTWLSLTYYSTLFDPWFHLARRYLPCLTNDLTHSTHDWRSSTHRLTHRATNQPMIRPMRPMTSQSPTHDSTLSDSWVDSVRPIVRPFPALGSIMFHSINLIWLLIRSTLFNLRCDVDWLKPSFDCLKLQRWKRNGHRSTSVKFWVERISPIFNNFALRNQQNT